VIPVARKEWGENASDNPASLSRRLSILAASIRVAGRFPSFRVLPSAIGKSGAFGRSHVHLPRAVVGTDRQRDQDVLLCPGAVKALCEG
jgi:hypothetical protein